jgi:hypothetical protein
MNNGDPVYVLCGIDMFKRGSIASLHVEEYSFQKETNYRVYVYKRSGITYFDKRKTTMFSTREGLAQHIKFLKEAAVRKAKRELELLEKFDSVRHHVIPRDKFVEQPGDMEL